VKNILYLHGFASSPEGRKVAALKELLDPRAFRIVAPDLNVPSFRELDFAAIVQVARTEAKSQAPAVLVGSSLGALAALEASRLGVRAPLLLIAPAVGFGRRWIEKLPPGDPLPFFHHSEGKELLIHRRFFEELAKVEGDREPPPVPVVVVMGTRDESVPYEHVRRVWRGWEVSGKLVEGSRFLEITDGDHGLVDSAETIAREIVALAGDAARDS
jgi:hypothetical protein